MLIRKESTPLSSSSGGGKTDFINFFSSPVSVDKEVYALSNQKILCWNGELLYQIGDFRSPAITDLRISGNKISFVSQENSKGDLYVYDLTTSQVEQMTYLGNPRIRNIGFKGDEVLFSAPYMSDIHQEICVCKVEKDKRIEILYRDCESVTYSDTGEIVVQRYGYGYTQWAGYQGGQAARLYRISGDNFVPLKLPLNNCHSPVFYGERLFFLTDSNEERIANVCEYDFKTDEWRQISQRKYCVTSLTRRKNGVMYSSGGDVFYYDCEKDVEVGPLPMYGCGYTKLEESIIKMGETRYTDIAINEKGEEVLVACRGKVLGIEQCGDLVTEYAGELRHRICGFAGEDKLFFGKDEGEDTVFYFYDKKMRQFYIDSFNPQLGLIRTSKAISETKLLAVSYSQKLALIDAEKREVTVIFEDEKYNLGMYFDVSKDCKWVVYSKNAVGNEEVVDLYIYNFETKKHEILLANGGTHLAPVFSSDQRFVYFLTPKYLKGEYCEMNFEMCFSVGSTVWAACLQKKSADPFKPWLHKKKDKDSSKPEDKSENKATDEPESEPEGRKEKEPSSIDFEHIKIEQSNIPPDKYFKIEDIGENKLLLFSHNESKICVTIFDMMSRETVTIVERVDSINLSNNKEFLIAEIDGRLRLTKTQVPFNDKDKSYQNGGWLKLEGRGFKVDRRAEWANILEQVKTVYKQKFWNPEELKDWELEYQKVLALLPRIRCRGDLNRLKALLIGRPGVSHAYIIEDGRDEITVKHNRVGSLHADFTWEDGYKIVRIKEAYDRHGLCAAPLKKVGLDIQEGDTIIATEGEPAVKHLPIEAFLNRRKEGGVNFTIRKSDGSIIDAIVQPCRDLESLIYHTWVEKNRRQVAAAGYGYIHIPHMLEEGLRFFKEQYRREKSKPVLVVDVRGNGGGNLSIEVVKELMNKKLTDAKIRESTYPWPYGSNSGKIIVLTNQQCASDGELFLVQIKLNKIAPIIGTRTWGGVIGYCQDYTFVDGSEVTVPGYGKHFDGFKVENFGVVPDIVVDQPLEAMQKGEDVQLREAIIFFNKTDTQA